MAHCPACRTDDLEERTDRSGVVYDACGKCRGVWLDTGELSQLLRVTVSEQLMSPKPGGRQCLLCGAEMQRGGFGNAMLVVDRCAQCRGLWLDGSELRVVRQLLGVAQTTEIEEGGGTRVARPVAVSAPEPEPAPAPREFPALPPERPYLPGRTLSAPPPAGQAPSSGWMFHAAWWGIFGAAMFVYGKMRVNELDAIRAAGGEVGASPVHLVLFGGVMLLLCVAFLIGRPDDPGSFYGGVFMAVGEFLMTPRHHHRHRRYWGRSRCSWYD